MSRVDIVQVNNGNHYVPDTHYAVEEERTERLLHECATQAETINWATRNGYTINIHRVRSRKPTDRHGRFR